MDRAILRFIKAADSAAVSTDPLVATRLVSGALSRFRQDAECRGEQASDWLWELLVALSFRADDAFGSVDTGTSAVLRFTDRTGHPIDPQAVMDDPEIAGGVNAMRLAVALHNQDTDTCNALLVAVINSDEATLASTVSHLALMPYRLRLPHRVPAPLPAPWWMHLLRRWGWPR
jgi:hypothetical protein